LYSLSLFLISVLSHHLIHGHLRNPLSPRTTNSHVSSRRPPKRNNKSKKNSHKRRIALEKSQKKLAALIETLNPIPFLPSKTLDFQTHQKLLRRLGLWDFVHIDFDRALRADLLAQLISNYSPQTRSSYVNSVRVLLNRADLARALKLPLPVKKNAASSAGEAEAPGSAEEVGFVENSVDSDLGLMVDSDLDL
jgi:hypothetical protein